MKRVSLLKKIFIFIFILGLVFLPSFYVGLVEAKETTYGVSYDKNITTYMSDSGEHTIYWAQGVNAPKMTSDNTLLGKDGYFSLDKYQSYETYEAEFKKGNGYYDLNKNLSDRINEKPLCYLGAAGNLILWWLDQNEQYVNSYLNKLNRTNIYGSTPGLYKVYPYNKTLWDEIRMSPGEETQNGYLAQKLGKTTLITKYLYPYYNKSDDGYFPDMVLDFFINGYLPLPGIGLPDANTEDKYEKSSSGGFFAPVFGKHRLSRRMTGKSATNYLEVSKNMKYYLTNGKGVSISYIINPLIAHAVTVWGAEYDENDNLIRLFITDSDDYEPVKSEDIYWRGLVGINTVSDLNGNLALTNNTDFNPNHPGNYISNITTFDLGWDLWDENFKDESEPTKPEILNEPTDGVYAKNANLSFSVDASIKDSGYLEYEWYVSDSADSKGTLIPDSNKNTINLKAEELGIKYYYCLVKNNKNGKITTSETRHFKVDVQDILLVDAATPVLKFNYDTVSYYQYDVITMPFKVIASKEDDGMLTYQWYQSQNSYAKDGIKLKGEVNPEFYPPTDKITDGLYYYCVVTNTNNKVTGNNKVSVTTPFSKRIKIKKRTNDGAVAPVITNISKDLNVSKNTKNAIIRVDAKVHDGGVLSYQWYMMINDNLVELKGETSNILSVSTENPGLFIYQCKVTNTKEGVVPKTNYIISNNIKVNVSDENNISNDNYLSSLIVNNGKLKPSFNPNILNYEVLLSHNYEKLDLIATANLKAKIIINNPPINIGDVKNVSIKVEAENGDVKNYNIKVTRSNEHIYGDYEIVKDATCIEDGIRKQVCKVCGHVHEEIIPKKGHAWNDYFTTDKEATDKEDGIKSHHCSRCDARKDITIIPKMKGEHNHNYGKWHIVKEPTCLESGIKERCCSKCGKCERIVIKALGHDFSKDFVIDKKPTYDENGIKSHHCSRCDAKDGIEEIPMLEKEHVHEFSEWTVVKKATSESEGLEERECSCGEKEERIIPRLESVSKNKFNPIVIILPIMVILGVVGGVIYYKKSNK